MTVQQAADTAIQASQGSRMVVISGGEPLAQVPPRLQGRFDIPWSECHEDPVGSLVRELHHEGVEVHFETAGIRAPSNLIDTFVGQYVVSPKLASSGNNRLIRYQAKVLDFFASSEKADFKFVVTSESDLQEVDDIVREHLIPYTRVWLMPEGITSGMISLRIQRVSELALERGYNVSSRLHVQIWGDERGR